jgi:hypothetical protein
MKFKLVEYELLKNHLLVSIKNLAQKRRYDAQKFINDYKNDKANATELAAYYPKINVKRRKQIGYILTTMRCLDEADYPLEQKKLLLNALGCHVYDLILQKEYDPERSWSNYISSFTTNADNSIFFTSLKNSLNLSADNMPSNADLHNMFSQLKKFLMSQIYSNYEKRILSNTNPYNPTKIETFNWQEFIDQFNQRIQTLESLSHAESQFNKPEKSEPSGMPINVARTRHGIFPVEDSSGSCRSASNSPVDPPPIHQLSTLLINNY